MNRAAIIAILFAAWTVGVFFFGVEWRDRSADLDTANTATEAAQVEAKAQTDARRQEHTQGQAMADIGATHEQARTAAQGVPAAVVADLRAGNLQLRDDLATCHTARLSEAAASAVERDAPAELRGEIAGALVQIVRDADDQVHATQAVIQADRAPPQQPTQE
ncbi:hypothetical protein DYQ93_11515 [Xanthomonas sp. LMG 8992]|uniref:DUF2514 family protein n=1 Tax=Xanthomonas sp. LMG 8992 TaxID=1591157 RepID=UPI00136D0004|nr:DUF2514 family protein [Xanthomonas sp. LMG 8992]MXV11648.1 hypothetical protein [Xanthomonas sp. LMG 8992]